MVLIFPAVSGSVGSLLGEWVGGAGVVASRAYHVFEVWSDWLRVRVRVDLIGLGPGSGSL